MATQITENADIEACDQDPPRYSPGLPPPPPIADPHPGTPVDIPLVPIGSIPQYAQLGPRPPPYIERPATPVYYPEIPPPPQPRPRRRCPIRIRGFYVSLGVTMCIVGAMTYFAVVKRTPTR
ncbi:hypothetical protein RUND412_004212 [Rhizina undulata]